MSVRAGWLLLLLPAAALLAERQAAGALARSRARYAAAAEVAGRTRVAGPAGATLQAADAAAAEAALVRLLGDRAAQAGIRLTATPAATAAPEGLVRAAVEARGPEAAVRGFSAGLESGAPLVRWLRWRVEGDAVGVRLRALAAAPWRP